MKFLFLLTTLVLSVALSPAADVLEGAPPFIDYQGSVLDDKGNPLAPTAAALYKMEFRIWNQIGGGDLIWSEQQTVTVFKGQFSVRLGQGTATTESIPPQVPQAQLPLAFEGSSRFLGVTVVTNSLLKTEITPRVAFLTTPYAHVANTASRVIQQSGTSSSVMVGGIGYVTNNEKRGLASISLTIDQRTNLITAGPAGTTAILPVNGDNHELLISKTDDSTQFITIAPPSGGQINGSGNSIRLKAKGESVTLQNTGANDWWIVDDTRDNTPVGTIVSYGGGNPPPGYLTCDGRSLLRADHVDLFSAISSIWGSSQASNPLVADPARFNLPNLTGRFLRGVDPNLSGADEEATSRTSLYASGNSGRKVGTYQSDRLKDFVHPITDKKHGHASGAASATLTMWSRGFQSGNDDLLAWAGDQGGPDVTPSYSLSVNSATSGLTINPQGGNESRPHNAGVRYCIKY